MHLPALRASFVTCLVAAALLPACATPPADAPWPERTVRIEELRRTAPLRISVPRDGVARNSQWPSGTAALRVHVDADGEVQRVALLQGSGNSTLDAAAIRGMRTTRFAPYLDGGVAVPVTAIAPMAFLQRVHLSPSGIDGFGH